MLTMPTVLERLADFSATLWGEELPGDVIHAAKRCLVDWYAAAIPGGVVAPATLFAEALAEELDHGKARLVPSGRGATTRAAALINGIAAHTIEFDDIFRDGIYHPGAPVIAAALALAESKGAGGERLVRAIIAGYEISTRLAQAVNPSHYRYWHTTGTIGSFGSAAAAAALLKLGPRETLHALANAGTLAAGLQQAFRADAMSKPLHAGHAAERGLLTALAAARGVTGAPDILEGAAGFGAAMSDAPEWDAACAGLGTRWNILSMTQKNHAACGHAHAAIDACLALRAEHGLTPEKIRAVTVGTYRQAVEITGNAEPRTVFEAKFSLPYCVAAAIALGRVRTEAFADEAMRDRELRALAARVRLAVDPSHDAAFPGRRAATVTIETTAGERLVREALTRKGDPDSPLSDAELNDKYDELVTPIIGAEAAKTLLANLWSIEKAADLSNLARRDAGPKLGALRGVW
jgi:2-methylcitrate dehydratase PrpD